MALKQIIYASRPFGEAPVAARAEAMFEDVYAETPWHLLAQQREVEG